MHFYILRGRAEHSKKHSRCKRAGGAERSKNRTLQVPEPAKNYSANLHHNDFRIVVNTYRQDAVAKAP